MNNLTERWNGVVSDEDLRRLLEEVGAEVRKHDPARGKWRVRGDEAMVWLLALQLRWMDALSRMPVGFIRTTPLTLTWLSWTLS